MDIEENPLQLEANGGIVTLMAKRAIESLQIYGFDGKPLHIYGAMYAGEERKFANPGKPYIITIVDAKGNRHTMKLSAR